LCRGHYPEITIGYRLLFGQIFNDDNDIIIIDYSLKFNYVFRSIFNIKKEEEAFLEMFQ
jgi:hypothetical protein